MSNRSQDETKEEEISDEAQLQAAADKVVSLKSMPTYVPEHMKHILPKEVVEFGSQRIFSDELHNTSTSSLVESYVHFTAQLADFE